MKHLHIVDTMVYSADLTNVTHDTFCDVVVVQDELAVEAISNIVHHHTPNMTSSILPL